jgi:outer membrane receptor protein involved in Fe transport
MKTTLIRTSSLALATALLAPAAYAQAPAQTAAAVEEDIGDIVVTARKREENLQDVPLSISAFSSATIEEQGLKSIVDIANVTPGLSFRQAFGRTFDRPVIRGMSNIQGAANVAFFLDGIFITGSIGGYNLDNLERVEVIKGPQSALFGRATFAGAVNYITRKPDDDFRGKISATVGEDGMREVSGYVSGPIVEGKLFAEVDGRVYKFGGQYTNVVDPVEKMGREESKSASATIRLKPTETLDIVARVGVMQDNDGAFPISRVNRVFGQAQPVPQQLTNNGAINCFAPNLRAGVFGPAPALRPVADNRARGYFCGEIPTPGTFGVNSNIFRLAGYPDALDRNIVRTSIRADLDVNDWTITAIGAYNRRKQISTVDQDYSDLRSLGFETIGLEGSRDYFGELKLLSPSANALRGIVGVSYFRDKDLTSNRSGSLTHSTLGRPFAAGDDPTVIVLGAVSRGGVETKAVYGQVEYDFNDAFTVSAEGRYQVEEPESAGSSSTTIAGVAFSRPLDLSVRYKKFLPRFTANYKATGDVMLYGVAAKGNKPGGFNTGVFNAVYPDAEVARLVGLGLDTFKEESAWSYEAGVKSSLLDNRLTLNVAGYYIDWKNQQLTQTIQAQRRDGVLGSVSFTSNVGASEVKGVELEARARLSENFSLRFGYAMQDSKIKSFVADDQADLYITAAELATLNTTAPLPAFVPAPSLAGTGLTSFTPCQGATPAAACTVAIRTYANGYLAALAAATPARTAAVNALLALRGDAAGNALPRVPKHQVQIGGDYDYEVDGDTSLFLRAQLAYESKRFVQVDNLGWAGDSYNLGLRAGVNFKSLTLTAYVTNALNDKTPVDILRSIDNAQTYFRPALRPGEATANIGGVNVSSANPRDFAVTAPRLRNFGVTASYKF